ncbi:thioredoxin family protein [Pseudoalteromonas sp.]|uniref:thioredoxin family protein n=1 Tax=Pseudoalteromonas sp. TaxID=53249 RepID=UPI0035645CD5
MFKKLMLLLTFCLPISALTAAPASSSEISAADLLAQYSDFAKQYHNFTPTEQELALMQKLKNKQVLVVLGTWCHDSAREVPRLLKLLDESQVPLTSLRLVTVNKNKQDDAGVAHANNVQYTPTIIVMQNGKELTRMVEKPAGTLAQDLTKNLP